MLVTLLYSRHGPSLPVATLTGSGALPYKKSLILTSLGLIAGTFFEGNKMDNTLIGGISKVTSNASHGILLVVVAVTFTAIILVMLGFTIIRTPVSISNVSVGAFLGAAVKAGFEVNLEFLGVVLASWIIAPIVAAFTTILIYLLTRRLLSRLSILQIDAFNRYAVSIGVLYLSYAYGANNIGLLNGLIFSSMGQNFALEIIVITMPLLAVTGVVLFSKATVKTMGEDLIVLTPMGVATAMFSVALIIWVFTQIRVPISTTQALVGSIIGAAFSRRFTIFKRRVLRDVLVGWGVATITSFILGLVISSLVF